MAFRKILTLAILLSVSITGFAKAESRPEVANNVIAYKGPEGINVWTLRTGERSANEALVQIEGIDHEWNLKIQKMAVQKTDKDTRYSTSVNGEKFTVLIVRGKCCGELYIPGEPQTVNVFSSEGLSAEGNAQAFLTDYLNQK